MAKATRLSQDWQPSDEDYLFCEANRPDLNVRETILQFKTYWIAQPMKAGEKVNWSRTWRNWVARARAKPVFAPKTQFETKADKARNFTDALEGRRRIEQPNRIIDIN
jgi:hypothetical protein